MALLWPTWTSEEQYESSASEYWQRSNSIVITNLSWDKLGVDVAGVPVEELVAVIGGHLPLLLGGRDPQLAVEGQ